MAMKVMWYERKPVIMDPANDPSPKASTCEIPVQRLMIYFLEGTIVTQMKATICNISAKYR
jgi:hypothetical protein